MRISDWSSDVCSSDLNPAGQYLHHGGCAAYHGRDAGRAQRNVGRWQADAVRNRWLLGCGKRGRRSSGRYGTDTRRMPDRQLSLFRSEEHTSELQSLMRISYAVFCLKKKNEHARDTYIKQFKICIKTKKQK